MADMLTILREKNPGIPFYSVHDSEFRPYGRVIEMDASSLVEEADKVAMPESGSKYVPDLPALEALPIFETVKNDLRGQGSCQIGYCWGYSNKLNCLEYHRASEHNIAVTDMVLLLAQQQDMEGLELSCDKIKAFYFPKGTVIEVYATTLHFCPCQVQDAGFKCIVVLPRGTNHPLEGEKPALGDGRLLWAKDKWLIAHPDAPAVSRGAYPGLHGENYTINY